MTQEDKELLLKDLCARLPYEVKVHIKGEYKTPRKVYTVYKEDNTITYFKGLDCFEEDIENVKPYLRPISNMTEEEKEELLNLLFDKEAKYFYIDEEGLIDGKTLDLMKEGLNYPAFCPINIELYTDFLLSHHFDYRRLIEKGLAFEAPERIYN